VVAPQGARHVAELGGSGCGHGPTLACRRSRAGALAPLVRQKQRLDVEIDGLDRRILTWPSRR